MFGELKDVETLRQNPRADEPEWHTFSVKLDHHNPLDDRTWKMVTYFALRGSNHLIPLFRDT